MDNKKTKNKLSNNILNFNEYKEKNGYKKCKKCKKIFPECSDYFHRGKKYKNGLRPLCKDCRNRRHREYYKKQKYKETNKKNSEKRNALMSQLKNDFSKEDWIFTLEFFDYKCAYCNLSAKEHQLKYQEAISKEHIDPVISRGEYTLGNIIPACKSCNSSKGSKELVEWYTEQNFFKQSNLNKIFHFINYYKSNELNHNKHKVHSK